MTAGHRVHLKGGEDVDPDEAGAGATVGGKDTPRVTLQRGDPTADGPAGEPAGPAAPRALARTHAHVHTHRLPGASLPHTRAVLGEEGPVLRPEPCAVGPCGQDLSLGGQGRRGSASLSQGSLPGAGTREAPGPPLLWASLDQAECGPAGSGPPAPTSDWWLGTGSPDPRAVTAQPPGALSPGPSPAAPRHGAQQGMVSATSRSPQRRPHTLA